VEREGTVVITGGGLFWLDSWRAIVSINVLRLIWSDIEWAYTII
jgi:hypothetical protein